MATWLDVQRKLRYNILHRTRKTVHSRSCPHLCPAPGPARSLGGRGGSLCPPHVVTLLPGPSHDHGCLTLCSPAPLGSCLKPVPRPPHAPHPGWSLLRLQPGLSASSVRLCIPPTWKRQWLLHLLPFQRLAVPWHILSSPVPGVAKHPSKADRLFTSMQCTLTCV